MKRERERELDIQRRTKKVRDNDPTKYRKREKGRQLNLLSNYIQSKSIQKNSIRFYSHSPLNDQIFINSQ